MVSKTRSVIGKRWGVIFFIIEIKCYNMASLIYFLIISYLVYMVPKSYKRKSNITIIIGTLNEEKRIAYPLKSFLPYGDVLVVDHYSTDGTVEVAKKLGARVIKYENLGWSESKEQMDFIFSHV